MKSIEKMREALKDCTKEAGVEPDKFDTYWITADACDVLVDEIEAEIERDYMRLPVDADGVPIRVGDDLRSASSKTEYTALGFWFDFDCGIWQVMVSSEQAMSGNMLRHVKPRTFEINEPDTIRNELEVGSDRLTAEQVQKVIYKHGINDGFVYSILKGSFQTITDELNAMLGGDAE